MASLARIALNSSSFVALLSIYNYNRPDSEAISERMGEGGYP